MIIEPVFQNSCPCPPNNFIVSDNMFDLGVGCELVMLSSNKFRERMH